MSTVTAITAQKRRKDRYSIYLDGQYQLSLSSGQLLDSGLRTGDELTPARVNELLADSDFGKALDRAYNYVSYRMRSRQETVIYLKGHYDPELAEAVVGELEQRKIVDDERFTQEWIDMRMSVSPRSRRELTSELRQKGIAGEVIEQALTVQLPQDSAEVVAGLIVAKRLQQRYPDERKLIQHLAGKGFTYDTIKQAIERLPSEA